MYTSLIHARHSHINLCCMRGVSDFNKAITSARMPIHSAVLPRHLAYTFSGTQAFGSFCMQGGEDGCKAL